MEVKVETPTEVVSPTGDPFCDRLISKMNIEHRENTDASVKDYYVMSDKLGEGAFATVYRGVKRDTGTEVALKVVALRDPTEDRKVLGSPEALARREEKLKRKLRRKVRILDNEISVLRKISQLPKKRKKSLVELHDVIAKPTEITVVMELLTGGELFDRVIELGSYTESDAALIMKRIMRGVRSLHMANIIHRDLKPENLVFKTPAQDSQIKITDFGLALIQGRNDIFENIVIGSPGYIAPEVITHKHYTPACDIWSMGCILYILLVGGPPFGANSNQELFELIKSGKYGYPSDTNVSASGKDLIDRMLTVDPEYRIDAEGIMKHPWLLKRAAGADLKNTVIKLKNFNAKRKIKAVALSLVYGNNHSSQSRALRKVLKGSSKEEGFTGEELVRLREGLFEYCDEDENLSKDVFEKLFHDMEYENVPTDAMFDVLSGGKEMVSVPEICIAMSTVAKNWTGSQALRYCFETYDRERTGSIPKEEVQKILKVIMGDGPFKKISAGLGSMFGKFSRGKSGDSRVSFQDFRSQFMKYSDTALKKSVIQPVNKLIKKITQIPQIQMARNRLSFSFTLASVKSNASGITSEKKKSFKDDRTEITGEDKEEDEDDDSSSDEDEASSPPPKASSSVVPISQPPRAPKGSLPKSVMLRKAEVPEPRFSWNIKEIDKEL